MRLNTKDSKKLGREIHEQYGSWAAARSNAKRINGVNVLDPNAKTPAKRGDRKAHANVA